MTAPQWRWIKCPLGHTLQIAAHLRYGGVQCTQCRIENTMNGSDWRDPTVYINLAPEAEGPAPLPLEEPPK